MKAKALIDEGAIGEPLSIRIKSNSGKGKTAWEIPSSADAWRQDKETGGGPLVFDDGHHKFALVLAIQKKCTLTFIIHNAKTVAFWMPHH